MSSESLTLTPGPAEAGATDTFVSGRDVESTYGIDLVTAETIRSGLIEVTRHMANTLNRSAFSNVVREGQDYGTCVHFVQEDGGTETVAVTEGCTHFAFTHTHMTNLVLDEWGIENLRAGDTLICNDPWRGSIHIPDVNLFRPVMWEGEVAFVLSDASHLLDMGGPVPGSFNSQATEVYSEGLRLPPTLIMSEDEPVRSVVNLILENTRTPLLNLGDLRALFGTLKVGETRLRRLLERYGLQAVRAASRYTLDLSERRMRAAIASVPDGVYSAQDVCDDDGVVDAPVTLNLTGRVAGEEIELDYSGTDRQPLGALTTCWEDMNRVIVGAKVLLDPNHPFNSGAMRPFHVVAPPGSVVLGLPPTSNSQHVELATKVCGVSLRLFSEMLPDRAVAAETGSDCALICSGIDDRPGGSGHPYGLAVTGAPAWGATSTGDGISFCSTALFGVASSVAELVERDSPLLIRSLNLLIDGAGAGKYRSGFCGQLMVECLGKEMSISFLLDSGRFPRRGEEGGGDGMTSYLFKVIKNEDNSIPQLNGVIPLDRLVPLGGRFGPDAAPDPVDGEWCRDTPLKTLKASDYKLKRGEVLLMVGAGGGGYGSAVERDPQAVAEDVWNERLTIDCARRVYGVVVDRDSLAVDAEKTASTRKELQEALEAGTWTPPLSIVDPWPQSSAELAATSVSVVPPSLAQLRRAS